MASGLALPGEGARTAVPSVIAGSPPPGRNFAEQRGEPFVVRSEVLVQPPADALRHGRTGTGVVPLEGGRPPPGQPEKVDDPVVARLRLGEEVLREDDEHPLAGEQLEQRLELLDVLAAVDVRLVSVAMTEVAGL